MVLPRLLLFLFVLCPALLPAQQPADPINVNAINYKLIDQLFSKKLDELRKSKNLGPLAHDAILAKAAEDQALYMQVNDTVTHQQKTPKKVQPVDRVVFYKGTHDGVGENCLFSYIQKRYLKNAKNKKDTSTTIIITYEQAAEGIFQLWKNSPLHYKNMIDPRYEVQGLGLVYNPANKKLFAAQVFGIKPYTYDKELLPLLSDYGIKPKNAAICAALEKEKLNDYPFGDRFFREGNKIYIYKHNPQDFYNTFKDPQDKVAIDIMQRDQFPCGEPNRFNGSPYYDGVLLPPVTFKEIFARNQGQNGALLAYVCTIPPELADRKIKYSVVIIKNNCQCSYTTPICQDTKLYDLINLQPFWDTIPTALATDSFHLTIKQKIRFQRGKAEVNPHDLGTTIAKLQNLGQFVKSVKLNAYSSVEGDAAVNKRLAEQRARVILSKLQPCLPKNVNAQVAAAENWNLFYRQIRNTPYAYLKSWNELAIKNALRDSLKKPLAPQLDEERYTEFEIEVSGYYDNFSNGDVISAGVNKWIQAGDFNKAHQLQSRLIRKYIAGEVTLETISEYDFGDDTLVIPFYINLLAAKCLNPENEEFQDKKRMQQLFKRFSESKKSQYNFCIYAIRYYVATGDTLVNFERLENMVKSCEELAPPKAVNSLRLNFHLTAMNYYTRENVHDKMTEHINAIHNLFSTVKLDDNSAFKLALYFSYYSMTRWVVELLEPYIEKNKQERFNHLYLAAGAVLYNSPYPEKYMNALARYIQLYPDDFVIWVGSDFQLMRHPEFKDPYCKLAKK